MESILLELFGHNISQLSIIKIGSGAFSNAFKISFCLEGHEETYILKKASSPPALLDSEIQSYRNAEILQSVKVLFPKCFGVKVLSSNEYLLLLEDLSMYSGSKLDYSPSLKEEEILMCSLAEFHSRHWGGLEIVQGPNLMEELMSKMQALWEKDPELSSGYIHYDQKVQQSHQTGMSSAFRQTCTVVHGDLQTTNIFFDVKQENVRLIDLQYVHNGNPMEDLALFLSTQKSSAEQVIPLLQLYLNHLAKHGIVYDYKRASEDFNEALALIASFPLYCKCKQSSTQF